MALPTETSYGLAADALNPSALGMLFTAKRRPQDEPVGIFVQHMDAARTHFLFSPEEEQLAAQYWPGPLNILLRLKAESPLQKTQSALAPGKEKISVRVSSHPVLQKLLAAFPGPVTSTSANRSGEGDVYAADRIAKAFPGDEIAYLLDAGILPENPPSTIAEWTGSALRIIRQGAVIPTP